jgi:tetratricopeptide (TPR) repeat protein
MSSRDKTGVLHLQQSLLPELSGFIARGDIMYMTPAVELLRGINFSGSGFSKQNFYVSTFIMPLCVPTKHLTLSFGGSLRIIGQLDSWSADRTHLKEELAEAIGTQAKPFLDSVASLDEFVERIEPISANPRNLEARGYALARLGRSDEAIETLRSLLQINPTYQWEIDLAREASSLLTALEHDPNRAKEITLNIEQQTRRNLKLPEIERL